MGGRKGTFDIVFLIARPAAGKSEIIDYLKSVSLPERAEMLHIGAFEEIDDFPMLWSWFEEDGMLAEMGYPRLHTDGDGYFSELYLWNLLIKKICLEYRKKLRDNPAYHQEKTTIIEFSRGREHGGFREAFGHVEPSILQRAAVLYIDVTYEESLAKNRRRFNPDRPDSILEHGLPDDKMEKLYRDSDWEEISGGNPEYLAFQGIEVPYAVFPNSDDVTTQGGSPLKERLTEVLSTLWEIYNRK